MLDLFSGLRGWSDPFRERGHETFTIELDERFEADAHIDCGDVGAVIAAVPWRPDIILASPPCTSFTMMTVGKNWTHAGEPKRESAVQGRRLVLSTVRIIAALRPEWWIIENPRARLRSIGFLEGFERRTVTYCHLGESRMKPTDLWGVFPPSLALPVECLNLPSPCPLGFDPCHVPAPRGSTTGTQGMDSAESAKIPAALSRLVCVAAEDAIAGVEQPLVPPYVPVPLWAAARA